MFAIMIAMACIIVLAPAVLVCIRNRAVVVAGVILSGITLAYLTTQLPPPK